MGGCGSVADKDQLAQDLDRITREKADEERIAREKERAAALEASECELRLQTDDGDLPIASVRAYGLETAGALLARHAKRLGVPAAGLELEFSNELVPAECVLQEAGIMEVRASRAGPVLTDGPVGQGATIRVLGVPAMRRRLVRTDADIRAAVAAWLDDPVSAEAEYGHIAKWNVKAVTDMHGLFEAALWFNQDVSGWDVSNVTNMQGMFGDARSFNQDLSGWDVSNVTNMQGMFYNANRFNQDLSGWDVSNVTDMRSMFSDASSFNQDVSGWDVSSVTNMSFMFSCRDASSFNQDVSGWDVSNVTRMDCMFYNASSFNQDLSGWDVSNVTNMVRMFYGASSFNQDVSGWDVSNVTDMGILLN